MPSALLRFPVLLLPAVLQAAAAYVRAEQAQGRIAGRVRPEVVASILVGACRDRAFAQVLAGPDTLPPGRFAQELVRTVVFGLAPSPAWEHAHPTAEEASL